MGHFTMNCLKFYFTLLALVYLGVEGNEEEGDPSTSPPPPPPPPQEVCRDESWLCPFKARMGGCAINPAHMETHCKLSCRVCKVSECEDEIDHCSIMAMVGHCQRYPGYMKKNCKKSCGECKAVGK